MRCASATTRLAVFLAVSDDSQKVKTIATESIQALIRTPQQPEHSNKP
jgi:hypothetical protein